VPKKLSFDDFRCPHCNARPQRGTASLIKYAIMRLDLPYFICVPCLNSGYSRKLLRQYVSRWRKDPMNWGASRVSYAQVWYDVRELMDGIMKHRGERLGYRFVRYRAT
jgi:hypothetical protein